jgi:hypothetical protein
MYGHRRHTCYRLTMSRHVRIAIINRVGRVLEKRLTNRPAQPFPSSHAEMKDSHSTGFDSGDPPCFLLRVTDGPNDPEAKAVTKAALRRRRRRTERVTSTPRIVTNNARITVVHVCVSVSNRCTQTGGS